MPTYHYRCKNCGYDFTEQQSFSDAPITVCPQCGQERVHKVYAAPSIEFKGSGFYRTDSREAGKSSLSSNGNGNGNGKTTSSEGGSSDKPAAEKPAAPAKAEKAGTATASTAAASS